MKSASIILALMGAIMEPSYGQEPEQKTDKQRTTDVGEKDALIRLTGSYRIVSGERGSMAISSDRLKEITVKITEKTITTYDRDNKEVYAASFRIDPEKRPWKIYMESTVAPVGELGSKSEGLIELSDKKLKLIYALPEGKTPEEFKTKDKQQMFVLERM